MVSYRTQAAFRGGSSKNFGGSKIFRPRVQNILPAGTKHLPVHLKYVTRKINILIPISKAKIYRDQGRIQVFFQLRLNFLIYHHPPLQLRQNFSATNFIRLRKLEQFYFTLESQFIRIIFKLKKHIEFIHN